MAVRSKTLGRLGCVMTFLCLVFLLISFSSDRWIQSSGKSKVGFENLGLWSACFDEYYPPTHALVNRKYDGCWWVLDKELDDLRDFLIPSWFKTTQVLVTLGLVLVLIDCIILVINLINCFPHSPYRHRIKRILSVVASLTLIVTAVLLFIAILIFGIKSSNTGGWLQNNDENTLSWSFGMCILADFLAILSSMIIALQFVRHRAEKDDSQFEPKVIVTNEPPPGTNYQYSRNNANRGTKSLAENTSSRDPAYVQRYYQNRDESKASLINPPTETFAVSGRGEVYVNNLATYDDNNRNDNSYRQRPPPPRKDDQRQNGIPVAAVSQSHRNSGQPQAVLAPGRGRQLGRQGHPLRLQEPSFIKPQTQRDDGSQSGSLYDDGEWKSSRHTSLPEYIPKTKNKNEVTATEEDSYEDNDSEKSSTVNKKKRQKSQDDADGEKRGGRRKSRSRTKSGDEDSRERSRSRSNSRSRSKKRNDSDTDGGTPSQRRRSKKKKHRSSSVKGDNSDEDQPTRRRSGSRKNTRSRSRSKDRYTSDSQLDSDTGSTHSRSRRKKRKEKELSRMDAKRRSASEDNLSVRSNSRSRRSGGRSKKKYDGNVSDDFSGSEYSHRRSKRKGGGDNRTKQRDNSDNESVKSRSKRGGEKPKGTYSSYYEY